MLTKRIIPCLDVDKGKVVKGKSFINLVDAGDPVDLAKKYYDSGADEIVFLDITASIENRETILSIVEKVSKNVFIPLTVGGGIKVIDDIKKLLNSFNSLIDNGHSIIVVEHNLDLIKCSDKIIDLGPYGGENGGDLVYYGSPKGILKNKKSKLKKYIKSKIDI